jgi:hypothetical protein
MIVYAKQHNKYRKGQSILEYTLVFTAIVASVLFGIKILNEKLTDNFVSAGNVLDNVASTWESQYSGGGSP